MPFQKNKKYKNVYKLLTNPILDEYTYSSTHHIYKI